MKKLIIVGALVAAIAVPGMAQAAPGNGNNLGGQGRACAESYLGEGATVGEGNRLAKTVKGGNNAGGVPYNLGTYC